MLPPGSVHDRNHLHRLQAATAFSKYQSCCQSYSICESSWMLFRIGDLQVWLCRHQGSGGINLDTDSSNRHFPAINIIPRKQG
jgi:hypothetical protein